MRFGMMAVAAAMGFGLTAAQPAQAVEGLQPDVYLRIGASIDVTRTSYSCDGTHCYTSYASFTLPWSHGELLYSSVFDAGPYTFEWANPDIVVRGTISYLGDGLFAGSDLVYSKDGGTKNCIGAPSYCNAFYEVGSAPTFAVVALSGAVPEPGTWALMLIGFGAIGGAMRWRHTPRLQSVSSP